MAAKYITEFKKALEEHNNKQKIKPDKEQLLKLIKEMENMTDIAEDVVETYNEIKKISIKYAFKLHKLLTDGKTKIIMTPFYTFCPTEDYENKTANFFLTTKGVAIYNDLNTGEPTDKWDMMEWTGNNAYKYVTEHELTDNEIQQLTKSATNIKENFTKMTELFFDMVKYPQFST